MASHLSLVEVISRADEGSAPPRKIDSGDGGGNDGRMEERVKKLEDDMIALRIDVRVIRETMASKTDIAELKAGISSFESTIIKWMVGTLFAAAGMAFGVAKLLQAPSAPAAPIVIQLPATAPVANAPIK